MENLWHMSCKSPEMADSSQLINSPRSGDREIHGSGEDTSVNSLPLFWRDGWELIWDTAIDLSPDSDLSRDASSDKGPVDNTSIESLEPAKYWIDLDLLEGIE